jgi:hypothetical protein
VTGGDRAPPHHGPLQRATRLRVPGAPLRGAKNVLATLGVKRLPSGYMLRVIGAVVASVMLMVAFAIQSGLICPDSGHAGHQHETPHHHHTGQTADQPICCWTLATCASPAAPATRTIALSATRLDRHVTVERTDRPRSIVFAPETPPPRA